MYFVTLATEKHDTPILFCCEKASGFRPVILKSINTLTMDDNILSEYYEGGYMWLHNCSELKVSATNEEIETKIAEWNFYRHFNLNKPDEFIPYVKIERKNNDLYLYDAYIA